ncbi:MAG: hypothetical protein ABIH08_06760 [Candidatus Omnitrophota bacterium]
MEKKVYQLDSAEPTVNLSNNLNPDTDRGTVLQAARDFKNSWRDLAQALQIVWKKKLYLNWGYEDFDRYTAEEVHVRKHTAMKLIRSHMFLEKEALGIEQGDDEANSPEISPTLEIANALQRAKKSLSNDDYEKVKKELLDEGKEVKEVKKGLKALIMKQRKEVDPEQERTQRNKVTIARFLALLKDFKSEIQILKFLPGDIAEDINTLASKIEKYSSQQVIEIT